MSDANRDKCRFAQYVDAYCDGELPPALEEEMHRHVFACASCSAAVRQTVEISDSISAIETRRLPQDSRHRIHSKIASSWEGGTMRFLRYMSGIAAVILVGASIWVARMGSVAAVSNPPGSSSDAHATELIVKDPLRAKSATTQSAPEHP